MSDPAVGAKEMDLFEAWCRLAISAATPGGEGRKNGKAISRRWLARLVK